VHFRYFLSIFVKYNFFINFVIFRNYPPKWPPFQILGNLTFFKSPKIRVFSSARALTFKLIRDSKPLKFLWKWAWKSRFLRKMTISLRKPGFPPMKLYQKRVFFWPFFQKQAASTFFSILWGSFFDVFEIWQF